MLFQDSLFLCVRSTYSTHYNCLEFASFAAADEYYKTVDKEKITQLVPVTSILPGPLKRLVLLKTLQNEVRVSIN